MSEKYSGLTYFLHGWMHQNWTDFYDSIEDAMKGYVVAISMTDVDQLIQCRSDIDKWLKVYTTNEDAENALNAMSVGYWFSDETMHGLEFLSRLRDAFDEAIKERKDIM